MEIDAKSSWEKERVIEVARWKIGVVRKRSIVVVNECWEEFALPKMQHAVIGKYHGKLKIGLLKLVSRIPTAVGLNWWPTNPQEIRYAQPQKERYVI